MAATIRIKTEEVRTLAAKIGQHNENLTNLLSNIAKTMDSLGTNDAYISKSGETIRAAMRSLDNRFKEFTQVIDSYKKFLENTAEQYEKTEAVANTNAGKFKT